MAAESDNCCTCCFSFLVTMGLTALFLWLSLRVDEPKCYLDSIYIPALNKSLNLNHPQNATVPPLFNFTLKLVNPNKDKGIRYDAVRINFTLFTDSNTTRPLANATVPRFYQGHNKKALKPANASFSGNLTAAVGGKVYFRVDFATAVRYKILVWYTKRDRLWGGANVEISDNGDKVYRKPVRLGNSPVRIENGAPELPGGYRALVPVIGAGLVLLNAHWLT